MKTIIYRVLVLMLVASMTLGMLNGCRKEDNEQPIPTVDNNHIDNSVITDGYIVENRKSLYKILTREEPSKYELSAAILLQDYLGYATEATVEIVSTVQAGEQYISVGKTDAFLTNVPLAATPLSQADVYVSFGVVVNIAFTYLSDAQF